MGLVYKFAQALIPFAGLPSPADTIPPPCLPSLGRSACASLTSTAGVSLFRKESDGFYGTTLAAAWGGRPPGAKAAAER